MSELKEAIRVIEDGAYLPAQRRAIRLVLAELERLDNVVLHRLNRRR